MARPMLPAAVVAGLASRIGSIAGCRMTARIHSDASRTRGHGFVLYHLDLDGWSPSLHRLDMRWSVEVDPEMAPPEMLTDAISQLQRNLDIQERRAADGVEAGSAWPLSSGNTAPTRVDHLHIDAMGLVLAMRTGTRAEIASRLRQRGVQSRKEPAGEKAMHSLGPLHLAIDELHREADGMPGGRSITLRDVTVREIGEMRVLETVQAFPVGEAKRPRATMRGAAITLPAQLPETVIASLSGRTVGDVVRLHPLVDHRRIVSIRERPGAIVIQTEPDHVRIGDYLEGTADDAIEALVTRTRQRLAA